MTEMYGASWARLARRTDEDEFVFDVPGIGWHLWEKKAHFPHGEMGEGFRYLLSVGPIEKRVTQVLHVVTDFVDFTPVRNVADAYSVLRRGLGHDLVLDSVGSRLQWVNDSYNRLRPQNKPMLVVAWAYEAELIDPVEIGDFNRTMTGWKRLRR